MVAVALKIAPPAATLGRQDVLARYRHLREISKRHHSELVRHYLAHDALLQHARRIGLAVGNTLVLEDMEELTFAFDLAIHTALLGRSRAIDRFAGLARFPAGSDETLVLEAMRHARFSIFRIECRHETAGVILKDLLHDHEVWLVDEGLESSAPNGRVIATRIYAADRFSMTAGAVVPLDRDMMEDIIVEVEPLHRKPPPKRSDDRRFAEAIYRIAIQHQVTEKIVYRDSGPQIGSP